MVLFAILLPPLLLCVMLALGRYEEWMLRPPRASHASLASRLSRVARLVRAPRAFRTARHERRAPHTAPTRTTRPTREAPRHLFLIREAHADAPPPTPGVDGIEDAERRADAA